MIAAIEARAVQVPGLADAGPLEALLECPEWDRMDGVRDRCDHVPAAVADAWEELPRAARLVAPLAATEADVAARGRAGPGPERHRAESPGGAGHHSLR